MTPAPHRVFRSRSTSSPAPSSIAIVLSAYFPSFPLLRHKMIKIWPSTPNPIDQQLTPRQERPNPFDVPPSLSDSLPGPGPQTPTYHHHLLNTGQLSPQPFPTSPGGVASRRGIDDPTPIGPLSPANIGSTANLAAALPTTQLSLHAPNFNMRPPQLPARILSASKSAAPSTSAATSIATAPSHPAGPSKGQIHVKLIQARGLNVRSVEGRPYVVVQFEQNEFVSREPTDETGKEVKGTAINLSRNSSTNALSALGAIGSRAALDAVKRGKGSSNVSPSSSVSSANTTLSAAPSTAGPFSNSSTLFGRLSAHNPVWKHEVSL
jgi:serine/threonine protein kinase SCH9